MCILLRITKCLYIFIFIYLQAVLALSGIYLTSNVLVFEKKINDKELEDIEFRSSTINQNVLTTIMPSVKDLPPPKDKCEPLYILIYGHCCVWFLFLVSYIL